jgi:predicted Fe-Mo cluster-binding NifX family protein
VRIAIPRFGESVAPCFEHSATITIFVTHGRSAAIETEFALQSQRPLDRVRLLRDQAVDTLICGGVDAHFEDLIRAHGIRVISWVSGNVDELVQQFLEGRLTAGGARLGRQRNRMQDPE